jgi:hypothetical protein
MNAVLPHQFGPLQPSASRRPEHRLMLAVLEDAVRTYQQTMLCRAEHGGRLLRETEDWFASDDAAWPFSFTAVCEALDLEPAWVRARLERWRQTHAPACRRIPHYVRHVAGARHHVTSPARLS